MSPYVTEQLQASIFDGRVPTLIGLVTACMALSIGAVAVTSGFAHPSAVDTTIAHAASAYVVAAPSYPLPTGCHSGCL